MRQHVSKKLKVAVLGATGATGRHVTAAALEHGHEVVALTRRTGSFEPATGLREVMWANLADSSALVEAFRGVTVVISALGATAKGPTTVCTDGIRSAISAMK